MKMTQVEAAVEVEEVVVEAEAGMQWLCVLTHENVRRKIGPSIHEPHTLKHKLVPYARVRSICLSSAPQQMVMKYGAQMISPKCPY
jgi:hypothetical protein